MSHTFRANDASDWSRTVSWAHGKLDGRHWTVLGAEAGAVHFVANRERVKSAGTLALNQRL